MTGATEAVTPEQRAQAAYIRTGGWRDAAEGRDCDDGFDEAVQIIADEIRHAEANALRRCHDLADQKAQACTARADACVIGAAGNYSKPDRTILDKRWHTAQAAAFRETAHAMTWWLARICPAHRDAI